MKKRGATLPFRSGLFVSVLMLTLLPEFAIAGGPFGFYGNRPVGSFRPSVPYAPYTASFRPSVPYAPYTASFRPSVPYAPYTAGFNSSVPYTPFFYSPTAPYNVPFSPGYSPVVSSTVPFSSGYTPALPNAFGPSTVTPNPAAAPYPAVPFHRYF